MFGTAWDGTWLGQFEEICDLVENGEKGGWEVIEEDETESASLGWWSLTNDTWWESKGKVHLRATWWDVSEILAI